MVEVVYAYSFYLTSYESSVFALLCFKMSDSKECYRILHK